MDNGERATMKAAIGAIALHAIMMNPKAYGFTQAPGSNEIVDMAIGYAEHIGPKAVGWFENIEKRMKKDLPF